MGAYEFVVDGAGFQASGPTDDHGNVDAGVINPSFASRESSSVVAPEDDHGVVGKAVGGESLENLAGLPVHFRDVVVIPCPVFARFRRVGINGRKVFCGEGRVVDLVGPKVLPQGGVRAFSVPDLAFVGNG